MKTQILDLKEEMREMDNETYKEHESEIKNALGLSELDDVPEFVVRCFEPFKGITYKTVRDFYGE